MADMSKFLEAQFKRATAVKYLWEWIGTPYIWGGDDFSSFDCSGLVVEVLQAVGIIPHKSDYTAAALYERFEEKAVEHGYMGCLVFWYGSDKKEKIIHVEMMVDDFHTVGTSGGGSGTLTVADAIRQNAFVKQRPIGYRGDKYLIVDPFKAEA
jgi:cell wall-associated NlpC family hydrolase